MDFRKIVKSLTKVKIRLMKGQKERKREENLRNLTFFLIFFNKTLLLFVFLEQSFVFRVLQ